MRFVYDQRIELGLGEQIKRFVAQEGFGGGVEQFIAPRPNVLHCLAVGGVVQTAVQVGGRNPKGV